MKALSLCALLAASFLTLAAHAAEPTTPQNVKWSSTDTQGRPIVVPQPDRPTVLLFVRADQPQSRQAARLAQTALKAVTPVQTAIILSGQQDAASPAKAAETLAWTGPVVLDLDYAASGALGVHVWPTTVVVAASGAQVAHMPGISGSYATELDAYLAYASGKIDAATLKQRLGASEVVGDTADQMAARHLAVAQRLMEKGQFDQAQAELAEGLKRQPKSAALQVAMTRALLRQGNVRQAQAMLEQIAPSAIPDWQRSLLKAQALLAADQWDAALPLLQESLKLNPEPAEAQYELGRVYAHKNDFKNAAEAFRAAFEATPAGRAVASPVK